MPESRYVHGHHASVLRSHNRRTAANSAAYLLGDLHPGMSLLDVGCGPGTITADLAERVAPGRVVALESAPEVLEQAEQTCAERGLTNVEFVVGDAARLDLPTAGFDAVHAHQVLQHVADPVAVLREMRRVCRPGGVVAARDSDYGAMAWFPRLDELAQWMAVYRGAARDAGGEPDAGRHLHAWARSAGFTDVTATASAWCYASADERAWWGGLWAERIERSAIASQAVDGGHATPADLARIAAGWRRWAEAEDACFIIPHGEIRCRV